MATYYVAPHGDDANAGTSPGAAFKTINQAAQVMVDGDICYVAPGVYRESVTIPSPGTGTKTVTFIGDPEARKFPGVTAGEVRLDGSDDDLNPVRDTGVSIQGNVVLKWRKINVARFVTNGFSIAANVGENVIEDCSILSCPNAAIAMANNIGLVLRRITVQDANYAVARYQSYIYHSIIAEDVSLISVGNGFDFGTVNQSQGRIVLTRVLHRGRGDTSATVVGTPRVHAEDVVAIGAVLLDGLSYSQMAWNVRRATIVRGAKSGAGGYTTGVYLNANSNDGSMIWMQDSLMAEIPNGIYASTYPRIYTNRCAYLDVTTTIYQGTKYVRDDWTTVTDGSGNVLLPDFTPVGAQLLRTEEENPIEGLRSARIDVPRVAYYKFQVAVSGANTITLKARKSHPTGTTVKFRVDEDPAKVVTLADTDEVQTVQLGPVEDLGPRFVPLEVWCQQVDFIDGHYLLLDSIQVV